MRSLVILCTFFAVLYGVQATGAFFRFGFGTGGRRTDPDTRAGESCTPHYVRRCGEPRLVEETVRPADDSGWGTFWKDAHTAGLTVALLFFYSPNVCQFERTYEVRTYSYEYRRYCTWGRSLCGYGIANVRAMYVVGLSFLYLHSIRINVMFCEINILQEQCTMLTFV